MSSLSLNGKKGQRKRERKVDVGQRIQEKEESQMKSKIKEDIAFVAVALINVKQKQLSDKIFKTYLSLSLSLSLSRFSLFVFSVG